MMPQYLFSGLAVSLVLIHGLRAFAQEQTESSEDSAIHSTQARSNDAKDEYAAPGQPPDHRSLKLAVGNRFKIGVGVGHLVLRNPEDAALIRQHFQVLTPENCMKPQSIRPAEEA
jgi:hypothetical protein